MIFEGLKARVAAVFLRRTLRKHGYSVAQIKVVLGYYLERKA